MVLKIRKTKEKRGFLLACPRGFEPPTPRLGILNFSVFLVLSLSMLLYIRLIFLVFISRSLILDLHFSPSLATYMLPRRRKSYA